MKSDCNLQCLLCDDWGQGTVNCAHDSTKCKSFSLSTSTSFPTKAGDLQGCCQELMHGLNTIIFLANCPLLFFATDVANVEKFSSNPNTFCNLGRGSNH